jgi:hypothetical protein
MKIFTRHKILFLFIAAHLLQQTSGAQTIAQGPLNGSMFTEESAGCLSCPGTSWLNSQNAMLPDSVYASTQIHSYPNCFMNDCYYARALMAENFGFSIPAASNIMGIKAEVLRKASAPNSMLDTIVRLLKFGNDTGSNHAVSGYWLLNSNYQVYGDSTDLWGTTWNPTEINSNTFGLFYKPKNSNPNFVTAFVDHIRLIVYYITATGIHEQQSGTLKMIYDEGTVSLLITSIPVKTSSTILKIYNADSKLMMEKQFQKNLSDETISLTGLKKGFYIAKLYAADQKIVLKISIKTK